MKKRNRWIALAAAFVLLAFTARTEVAYGAAGIETEKSCSIRFDLSHNYEQGEGGAYEQADGYSDLNKCSINVNLYKAADVDQSGHYIAPRRAEEDKTLYEALKTGLAQADASTTAARWMEMAAAAAEAAEVISPTKTGTVRVSEGETVIGGLSTGLYLVTAETRSAEYLYTFTPYLVSLPGNDYTPGGETDNWLYEEVPVGLKAGRTPRYGDLQISKTLKTFNASLGNASFIFRVEAVKDQQIVYQDVVSLTFDAHGTKSLKIEGKIPAGAAVTVTEIYGGSAYRAAPGDGPKTVKIIARDLEEELKTGELAPLVNPAQVSFTNDYSGGLNGGTSVVNHFTRTEAGAGTEASWKWTPLADCAEARGAEGE